MEWCNYKETYGLVISANTILNMEWLYRLEYGLVISANTILFVQVFLNVMSLFFDVYFVSTFCSLITTPPPERVPIRTRLSSYSKEKMISATKYELDRDGQVFYVLPRIKGELTTLAFLL